MILFLSASFKGFKKKKDLIKNEMKKLKEKKEKLNQQKLKLVVVLLKNPIDQSNKKVWQLIKDQSMKNRLETHQFLKNTVIFL